VLGLDGETLDCINHSGTAGIVMILVVCFSFCVQAAEGLHYGVVPYVSKTALGVVSGMVGAGGNTGALIIGLAFFRGGSMRTDQAIIYMGIVVICLTGLLFFVYFPDKGSMLFKAGGLGSYDPQIIKPPAGYKGADDMDFAAAERTLNAAKKNEGQSHGSTASSTTTSSATYERA